MLTFFLLQTVIVWDSESQTILEEKKHHERDVSEICWIAADTLASCCSRDRTVVIHRIGWDVLALDIRLDSAKRHGSSKGWHCAILIFTILLGFAYP